MPEYRTGDWRFSAGLRGTAFSDDSPAWLPAAGIVWTPNAETEVSLAYSETVRLPSYTELNYNSPTSLGNAGLDRQHARSLELAASTALAEGVRVQSLAFVRRETNSVDWLKTSPGSSWLATNLDSVDVWGARLGLDVDVLENLLVQVGGEVLRKHTADEPYSSRYALDYPEATAQVAAVWQALSWCEVRAEQSVSRMTENPERGTDRRAWLGSLSIILRPPRYNGLSVTLGVDNVWDEASEPVVGVEAPGRRAHVSLAYEW
jgi:iron complex outermembrane receptor protein